MEELNTIRQGSNESVINFHNRLERLTMRVINAISCKKNEELGRIQTIQELALQRFIYNSQTHISRFLRGRTYPTLSEALTAALEEERAVYISRPARIRLYRVQSSQFNSARPEAQESSTNTHTPRVDSFQRSQRSSNNNRTYNAPSTQHSAPSNSNVSPISNHSNSQKQCRYCKNYGHLINECRKRAYVNSRRNNQG